MVLNPQVYSQGQILIGSLNRYDVDMDGVVGWGGVDHRTETL